VRADLPPDVRPADDRGRCDDCGGELVQRDDDTEDVVLNRLEVYRAQTEPLEHFYWERGLLRDVEAVGEVDDVRQRIQAILQEHGQSEYARCPGRTRSSGSPVARA
jgi:adenylate kinase